MENLAKNKCSKLFLPTRRKMLNSECCYCCSDANVHVCVQRSIELMFVTVERLKQFTRLFCAWIRITHPCQCADAHTEIIESNQSVCEVVTFECTLAPPISFIHWLSFPHANAHTSHILYRTYYVCCRRKYGRCLSRFVRFTSIGNCFSWCGKKKNGRKWKKIFLVFVVCAKDIDTQTKEVLRKLKMLRFLLPHTTYNKTHTHAHTKRCALHKINK